MMENKKKQAKLNKLITEFQQLIEYKFNNEALLRKALTTSRHAYEYKGPHYKGLDTVGDTIIKFILALKLYDDGITTPGRLTILKSDLEQNKFFNEIAQKYFNLTKYIIKSRHEIVNDTKIIADVFEAICAAIFLDANRDYNVVEDKIINKFYEEKKSVFIKEN